MSTELKELNDIGFQMMFDGYRIIANDYIKKNYKDDISFDRLYSMNVDYLRGINKDFVLDPNFKRYYDRIFNIEFCKYKLNT
jgi:hypothetical protein